MRKTLIAITIGLTALAAAACGNSGTGASPDSSVLPGDSVESMAPVESALPSDMLESPAAS
jgi:ABC-type glycerol-3-phosphate transport system substrate-binding protein